MPNLSTLVYPALSRNVVGKTAVQAVGTSATAIVTNSSGSGKILRLNLLLLSNINGSNAAEITVDLYRSSTAYRLMSTTVIPVDSTIDLLSKPLYLEEGDSLRLTATAAGDIEAVCSYEEIS
jgi:hypothetical protein